MKVNFYSIIVDLTNNHRKSCRTPNCPLPRWWQHVSKELVWCRFSPTLQLICFFTSHIHPWPFLLIPTSLLGTFTAITPTHQWFTPSSILPSASSSEWVILCQLLFKSIPRTDEPVQLQSMGIFKDTFGVTNTYLLIFPTMKASPKYYFLEISVTQRLFFPSNIVSFHPFLLDVIWQKHIIN